MKHKFKATQIFDGHQMHESDMVCIFNEQGQFESLVPLAMAGDDVKTLSGILSPGFVNCHCHLELSCFKDKIPQHTGLPEFVRQIVSIRPTFSDQDKAVAIEKGYHEMFENGIMAVGDISNDTTSIVAKRKAKIQFVNFIEVFNFVKNDPQACLKISSSVYEQFQKELPFFQSTLVPHACYTVSFELWDLLIPHYESRTVSIHNQECPEEEEFCFSGTGAMKIFFDDQNIQPGIPNPTKMRTVPYYAHKMKGAKNNIFVHNVQTKESDIALINQTCKQSNNYFCLCINANRYIQNSIPPIDLFRKTQSKIVLGTDSLASNFSLSILDEIKTIRQHFPHIPVSEILSWATAEGAAALELSDTLGSFKQGKKPGLVLLDNEMTTVKRLL
ncbi:MAG: amidohydrolase family protein [Phycisphaerales bacterium]|nr:amidohydrolase family protein [Phycisphaerales bacterium]